MKKLIAILALSLSVSAVDLAWNPSQTPGVTYLLVASTNQLNGTNWQTATVRLDVGTNLAVKVTDLTGLWRFAALAVKDGIHSDLSNVLTVEVPNAPGSMRTVVLQYGVTVTNFVDVGFFKVRIQ